MNEAHERARVERRRRGLDAVGAQLGVADVRAQRELDVQRGQRATARGEPIEQAIDRRLEEEHEPLDIVLVVVEDDVLVGRFGRRHRHERIPALAGRELIQPVRLATEPLEDAAAGQPHHLAERRHAEPRERVAQLRIDVEPRERHRTRRGALVGIAAQHGDAGARRARDRVRREPREPDDDRAAKPEPGDRVLDRHAPRLAVRSARVGKDRDRAHRHRARTCPGSPGSTRGDSACSAARSSVIAASICSGGTTRARSPRCKLSACA